MRISVMLTTTIALSILPAAQSQQRPADCTPEHMNALFNHYSSKMICDYLHPETMIARAKHMRQLIAKHPGCEKEVEQSWAEDGNEMKALRAQLPAKAKAMNPVTAEHYRDLCSHPVKLDTLGAKRRPQQP